MFETNINNKDLRDAVALLKTVIPTSSHKSILTQARIVANKGGDLRIEGTDLTTAVSYYISESNTGIIDRIIDFERLGKAVKSLSKKGGIDIAETIDPATKDHAEKRSLAFKTTKITHNLNAELSEDFPESILDPELINTSASLSLSVRELLSALKKITPALPQGDQNYSLSGVCFDFQGGDIGKLSLVCTDTFRLATYAFYNPIPCKDHKVIMPQASVKTLIKALDLVKADKTDKILITVLNVGKGCYELHFKHPLFSIHCRTIEGNYPQVANITPKDLNNIIEADRLALIGLVKGLSDFTNPETRGISLSVKGGLLTASAKFKGNESKGSIVGYSGGDIEIGLNWKYLVDLLEAIDLDRVTIECKDQDAPIMITNTALTYIVAPLCTRDCK